MTKIYSHLEAYKSTLEYFSGDIIATETYLNKYILRNRENEILELSPRDMHLRLASEFARIEKKKYKKPLSKEEIFKYLDGFKRILPQGSPMYAIGNPYQYVSASNCFVIDLVDSYGGICKADEELVQIAKRRGGVGFDLSCLRPKDSPTTNSSRTSTGIIPFMHRFSNAAREVGQGGRRAALMITISVHHPEILDFINAKTDLTKVTGANISVKLSDEFMRAVKKDEDYEQRWPVNSDNPSQTKRASAKMIWDAIVLNAHNYGEPGILFWDNIINNSPSDCYPEHGFITISTNPCAELPLPKYDSCRLICQNLYSYVENPFTSKAFFNYEKFSKDAMMSQRIADNLIDLEHEFVQKIISKIKNDPEDADVKHRELSLWANIDKKLLQGRRTGTGTTALGDTLAALGLAYGSNESFSEVNKIFKTLKLSCYRSSVNMAKELGAFPIWDHEKEKNNAFLLRIKDDDPQLYKDMKKYGRRNIGLLTGAPTGTLSILTKTTSGVEPLFQEKYTRRRKIVSDDKTTKVTFVDPMGDKWHDYEVIHPKILEWQKITGKKDLTKSPWHGSCSEDLDWKARVKLQAIITNHFDHSVSSTCNLPEDVSVEDVKKIYETAYESNCKGITVYRKNSRSGVLIDLNKERKAEKGEAILKTSAPKRPAELPCDVFHSTIRGQMHHVVVGLLEGEPYEIFSSEKMKISSNISSGIVKKLKRGHYQLVSNGESQDIANAQPVEEAITRLISTSLRHGSDISFIVHQLEKARGDITGFEKALARILKKYIPNGKLVTGESCKKCGSNNLRREDGCVYCSCGWSRCC